MRLTSEQYESAVIAKAKQVDKLLEGDINFEKHTSVRLSVASVVAYRHKEACNYLAALYRLSAGASSDEQYMRQCDKTFKALREKNKYRKGYACDAVLADKAEDTVKFVLCTAESQAEYCRVAQRIEDILTLFI